jgi:GMP synthase (glutamine-hydrolysing)
MRPRIGLVKPGSTFAEMILAHGDYDAWFARALGEDVAVRVHEASLGELPDPAAADGWIVTGARSSVIDRDPTTERLLGWIREVAGEGVPLLGVCWGHQAICEALGGRVERHPGGWEIGTVEVELTDAGRADALFEGFPDRFRVQTTHEDHAVTLPPEAVLLATNLHTAAQAVALGDGIRGVQFHPEVTEVIARAFVARRRHLLPSDPELGAAPLATRVLTNFVTAFATPRSPQLAEGD